MAVKILDSDNSGFYSWWASGITYAADNGADVINLSAGGSDYSEALEAAADYAAGLGIFFTASMMNFNNDVTYYPAGFASVVAVGATDTQDRRAAPFCWGGGSNYGEHIELSAPGDWMASLTWNSDTNYEAAWCGTSMAAPLVAATATLMLSANPGLEPDEILQILRATAQDEVGRPTEDVPGFDIYHGHGRLNAFAALSAVTTTAEPSAPESPVSLVVSPNPSREHTDLRLTLGSPQHVRVEVFDGRGRRVALPHEGTLPSGVQRITIAREALAAGVYLVRVTGEEFAESRVFVRAR
jgi:subtilisin family serine protease